LRIGNQFIVCGLHLFGGAQAFRSFFAAVGIGSYRYLFNAFLLYSDPNYRIITCSPTRTLTGSPGALGTNGNKTYSYLLSNLPPNKNIKPMAGLLPCDPLRGGF
jgi:hypothetical protein